MSSFNLWRPLINTFNANTATSNVKMLTLATDTHAKLKAEESSPPIAEILTVYEPVFFAYRDICQQYDFMVGDYRGATLGFENIIETLPQVIRVWESAVRAVYVEDTPEERAIFPNKRTPFLSGTYENRLNAIGALATKTASIPALAGVAAQISSFYNTALAARLAQQTDEGSVGQITDLRENQRVLLSNELMGVLGKLMFIHRHNLVEVERYFDLSLLRRTGNEEPVVREGDLMPGLIANIDFGDADLEDASIKLESTGSTMTFFASNSPNGFQMGPTAINVLPGEVVEMKVSVLIAQLGLNETNSYFNVQNIGGAQGSWKATVTE